MLTLNDSEKNTLIGYIVEGSKKTALMWHPVKKEELRMDADFTEYFESKKFRNRYELTRKQQLELVEFIYQDETPDDVALRKKFYKIRSDIEASLYTELRLDSDQSFEPLLYPHDKKVWPGTGMINGASQSGKTHWVINNYIKANLDGKASQRRRFLYLSAEANSDKSLAPLKRAKYRERIEFVDLSEQTLKDLEVSPQEFWDKNVLPKIEGMPTGSVIIGDDYMDSVVPHQMRKWTDRALRTYRHRGVGALLLQHSLKNGIFSSQAHNSVKFFLLFPRSAKHKIRDWLQKDIGLSRKEADMLDEFAQSGRWMIVNVHTPNFMANDKMVKLF